MHNKKHHQTLLMFLVLFCFLSPSIAAWPVLNDKDMKRFIQTFPTMYQDYRVLGLKVNPQTGQVAGTDMLKRNANVQKILKKNGWNFRFWPQLQTIARGYSLLKQQQFQSNHGSNIDQFVSNLKNSPWMTPDKKAELEAFYSKVKGDFESNTNQWTKQVNPKDLAIIRSSMPKLESVMAQIAKFEWDMAMGEITNQMPMSEPQPISASVSVGQNIKMTSSVYNPWNNRCSGVLRDMYVRQPAQSGEYPVFLFMIGTLRKYDNEVARHIIDRAAERGFVAASVDYDTIASKFKKKNTCDSPEAKAECSFSAPESALSLICNNVLINGQSAGLYANCDKGVVVAGFSQGGTLAMLARNYDERVRAVWSIGFHDQALLDDEPLQCLHSDSRMLPSDRLRIIVGEGDRMLRRPHQLHLQTVTGRICEPGSDTCFAQDGSGWAIVPNRECGGNCKHEYLDTSGFLNTSSWWGLDQNLGWLEQFVEM